ncbi:hypothetical protein MBLNU230_g0115t1 [Neophaeotheca triangularis]
MHLGGLRTALFSYLLAKRTEGQFLLRIEDTDQKRLVPDAEARLCDDLAWAGLQWDEGPSVGGPFGPYKQSERNSIYRQHAEELLDKGSAYRCFCTAQTAGAGSQTYVTSGCYQDCASLPSEQAEDKAVRDTFTVRLKPPKDLHKQVYLDLIYGKIKRLKRTPTAAVVADESDAGDASDTILIKSDGTPTYHFANVVDDHCMRITHVIRGTEWMASTPLHVDLYRAFGWEPPHFAHVGLLLDKDKAKLSKRNADLVLDVQGLRDDQGVLPEALCNFLALLGWSNPGKNDLLDMAQLVHDFDLKFTKGNTVVTMEKLWYLQKHHVQRRCEASITSDSTEPIKGILSAMQEALAAEFGTENVLQGSSQSLPEHCKNVLLADNKSYTSAPDFVDRNRYFFTFDPSAVPQLDAFHTEVNGHTSSMDLDGFIQRLTGSHLDYHGTANIFPQTFMEPLFPHPKASGDKTPSGSVRPATRIESESARIHAMINALIWETVLCPEPEGTKDIPFTNKPVDVAAYARHFVEKDRESRSEAKESAKAVEQRYKDWNKAVMRYLRVKLAYGLPGPSVGIVMAVLGYDECCKRLGVEGRKGTDWTDL